MIEELIDRFSGALKKYAISLSGNQEDADDLVQETFARAMSNIGLIRILHPAKQRSWLFTTLRNYRTDTFRRLKFETLADDELDIVDESDHVLAPDALEALGSLPEKFRDAVIKHYWLGMSSTEIGQILGMSPATVRFRLHTALNLLKTKFKP
jgi:RNA polymerase sigma-70 factor, ECF subfamily